MTPNDISRVRDFYESAYALYGDDVRSVRWADTHVQQLRFEVLSHIAPLEGMSVLDVGCGLGDLYKFFLRKQIAVEYTGIDIVPSFITRARELYPDACFECKSFSEMSDVGDQYDYIFASGALSITVPDAKAYYFAAISSLYAASKRGFAFNMLNRAAYEPDETYTTYDIDEVTAYCNSLCNDVTVITDYLPWDFTVFMRK